MADLSRRAFAQILGTGAAVAAVAPLRLVARPGSPIRLSSNENPYGASPVAIAAMRESLALGPYYPDDAETALARDLAALHGVAADQILLGAGSSEILRLAAAACLSATRKLVLANPTFEAIDQHARAGNAEVLRVPLTPTYAHDLARMSDARDVGLFYICNPNNPTGTITPKNELRKFVESVPATTTVLVDEAYHHYATSSDYATLIPLIASRPNLVVARTFSKIYGMAGLRIGYAVGHRETIAKLAAQQQWNSVNCVGLAAAQASLGDAKWVEEGRRRNEQTKRWLVSEVESDGYRVLPSETNFVMIDTRHEVRPLISGLRERGVRVGRLFSAMPNFLRVTIGTPDQMRLFVDAFRSARSLPSPR